MTDLTTLEWNSRVPIWNKIIDNNNYVAQALNPAAAQLPLLTLEVDTPPPPPTFVKPDITNTGDLSGITRTTYTGPMTITANGTVISNKNINGFLIVNAADVLIKNCKLTVTDYGIDSDQTNSNRFIIQDSELDGTGSTNGGGWGMTAGPNCQVLRCHIHGFSDGIHTSGNNLRIIGNYIHGLGVGSNPHVDCIQDAGTSGSLFQGNALYGWDTSNFIIKTDSGSISNHTFDNNWMLNEPGKQTAVCIYLVDISPRTITGCTVSNNIMQPGYGGYVSWGDNARNTTTWTGNTDFTTGAAIPKP